MLLYREEIATIQTLLSTPELLLTAIMGKITIVPEMWRSGHTQIKMEIDMLLTLPLPVLML
jgi:hypothetical protein